MPQEMAVEITIYLSESDKWHGRPLHVALLNFLREEKVFAATVFHAVGGFVGRQRVKSAHLVDAGGKLPIVLVFIDQAENVERVLPQIKEMAPTHLILRESVTFEQGSLT